MIPDDQRFTNSIVVDGLIRTRLSIMDSDFRRNGNYNNSTGIVYLPNGAELRISSDAPVAQIIHMQSAVNGLYENPAQDVPAWISFYYDGGVKEKIFYSGGKKENPSSSEPAWRRYYPSGIIAGIQFFKDGDPQNPEPNSPQTISWHKNGVVSEILYSVKGIPQNAPDGTPCHIKWNDRGEVVWGFRQGGGPSGLAAEEVNRTLDVAARWRLRNIITGSADIVAVGKRCHRHQHPILI